MKTQSEPTRKDRPRRDGAKRPDGTPGLARWRRGAVGPAAAAASLAALLLACGGCEKAEPEAVPAPRRAVSVDAAAAGIRTEAAVRRAWDVTVEAKGELVFDPGRLVDVTARAAGRIEAVAAYKGDRVSAGQVLLEMACPAFVSDQEEWRWMHGRLRAAGSAADSADLRRLADAAAARLVRLGLDPAEVAGIAEGPVMALLPVRTPIRGAVIEASPVLGSSVPADALLYRIGDLSRLWVEIHLYERDLDRTAVGDRVEVRTDAFPGLAVTGRLAALGGIVEPGTRTVEARAVIDNPAERLKPGMFARVFIRHRLPGEPLTVPEAAVMRLEGKDAVFVASAEGSYEPRAVRLGRRFENRVEVLEGLAAGETVVTAGGFTLKSEWLRETLEEE